MKKIVIVVIFAVLAMMPCIASAQEEDISLYISISIAGKVQCANEKIEVSDLNNNGKIDIDDSIVSIADVYGAEYESSDMGFGKCIVNLWGDDSGSFGYYLDDVLAINLEEEIHDGAFISVYSYQDCEGWSDSYAYFNEKYIEVEEGEKVTLTLNLCHFDENWNTVSDPFKGAKVMEGETELGITDENGKITLELEEGSHVITAYSNDEEKITVPASAVVVVNKNKTEGALADDDNIGDDISSYNNDENKEETGLVHTPKTGVDVRLLAIFILLGTILSGLAILRRVQ